MLIIGISAFYHDSGAAIIEDGNIIAAAEEERFTRIKHDNNFPFFAIKYCIAEAGCNLNNVDYFVFYDKPFLKFERLLETYLAFAPKGFNSFRKSMPVWMTDKLNQKKIINNYLSSLNDEVTDFTNKIIFSEHHLSHAASAFYASPFKNAAVLTMDGVGEWASTSVAIGNGNDLKIIKEIHFPHSLGLLYSTFTSYLGFKVNSGEYKLMGLAPYGKPIYKNVIIEKLIDLKEDGSFALDQSYFNYCFDLKMFNIKFESLFGLNARKPTETILRKHMDIAASIQAVTEEIILRICNNVANESGEINLCLAGGVALNCVANGKLLKSRIFKNIWIQPASGDSGAALGAALAAYYIYLGKEREINQFDSMQGSYLGPRFTQNEIESRLKAINADFVIEQHSNLIEKVAKDLQDGKIIGWFQGRMEFGPRSLGNRSILADPRSSAMQKSLNLKIKFRESFRPFAPSVLHEELLKWFDLDTKSPYMLFVGNLKEEHRIELSNNGENLGFDQLQTINSAIPAVTHVDYSARIQTVHKETNLIFYSLIEEFNKLTGCPILVNTSFNVRGEPVVCSPEDAYNCFMGTEIDVLVIGNCYLEKSTQLNSVNKNYKENFSLD
jgi:carbamoyltransferase